MVLLFRWILLSNISNLCPIRGIREGRHHLLVDVIVIAVCGVIVGCEGPTAIARWANAKKDWLGQLLELPYGIPSRDCLRRVLSTLKPEAFQECFQRWTS